MHLSTLVVALASSAITCSAAPSSGSRHVLHEKRDGEPHLWEKRERAIPSQVLPIRIGLRQRNLEHAERYIYDVSDPTSPNFGKLILDRRYSSIVALKKTFLTRMTGYQASIGLRNRLPIPLRRTPKRRMR
jgi:tripeptidyl-peptidase-1